MHAGIISCAKLKKLRFILEAVGALKEFKQENDMIRSAFKKNALATVRPGLDSCQAAGSKTS